VLGVCIEKIERYGADFATGIGGGFTVLRTRQIEKRIKGLVTLEVRYLQGKPQSAVQRVIEQRAVAGFIQCFANGALAFDEKGFVAHTRGHPFAIGEVIHTVALALELLQEYVLVVAHRHAHAPSDFAIEPGKQRR